LYIKTDHALQVERQRSERVTQRLAVAGNMLSKALYNLQPASPQLPGYVTLTVPFTVLRMTTSLDSAVQIFSKRVKASSHNMISCHPHL